MTIRSRLILSFVAILFLFALNLSVYFFGNRNRQAGFDALQRAMQRQKLIATISKSLSDNEKQIALLSQAITGASPGASSPNESDLFDAQLDAIGRNIAELLDLTPRDSRSSVEALVAEYKTLQTSWHVFMVNSGADQSTAITELAVRGEPLSRQILQVRLPQLRRNEELATEGAIENYHDVTVLTDRITIGIFLLSTVVAVVLGYTVSKRLASGLDLLKHGAAAIGRGDLDHEIELKTNDELGHLARAFNDMTANLRITEQLKSRVKAAEEASRLKSEFLATMSHEIRTPMNGVLGMTSFLLEGELNEEQRSFAETVLESANALMCIINDILDFSKIEAGKLSLEILEFNLPDVVEGSVQLMAEQAHQKGIELACWIAPDVPRFVRGDPGRLRQILLNLVGNAVKFTAAGEVVVRMTREETLDERAVVNFSVQDSGVGIPEAAKFRLFQPFSQADGSTTRRFGGTGLGLAICKQLVEMLGGKIGFSSVVHQGSTFWFTMPFSLASEIQPAAIHGNLEGVHALAVDDNATNREILNRYFDSWKMRSEVASSGAEAVELLRHRAASGDPFRLVVLDMHMPEMDGLETAARIKADPAISTARLVLLTSMFIKENAAALRQIGIASQLTKPVRKSDLFDALEIAVGSDLPHNEQPLHESAIGESGGTLSGMHKNGRILVAEDNSANQKMLLQLLKALGYSADVVANGSEVLDNLGRIPYSVVLMDCQMPEMDGFEATARIRALPNECSRMPIIAMTSHTSKEGRPACLAAGMDDYLSKPVDPQLLASVLERWALPANQNRPTYPQP